MHDPELFGLNEIRNGGQIEPLKENMFMVGLTKI